MTEKTYLINRITNKKYRLDGIKRSDYLPDKSALTRIIDKNLIYESTQLPPKVDLRQDMTPVEDQFTIAAYTANSLAALYEYLKKKEDGYDTNVSRLFIYYNARVKSNCSLPLTDSGCTIAAGIQALEEYGTCLESTWPYDESNVNIRPNDEAYEEAKQHRITEAVYVGIDLQEMKSCLAQGFPFAFGLVIFPSFHNASKTGVVPMPNLSSKIQDSRANHAMVAVGYSEQSRAFIVRNSWGEQWGDRGYCYIPYDYMTNLDYCFDAWTIRKLMSNDFSREHWSYDDNYNYLEDKDNTYHHDESVIETLDETAYAQENFTLHPDDPNTTFIESPDDVHQYITE